MKCNCKICVDFDEKYTKELVRSAIDFVRWEELGAMIAFIIVGYLFLGIIGAILGFIFNRLLGNWNGGIVIGTFPEPEYPPNVCSAGIEGCQICNNPYSHEFNSTYKPETFLQSLRLPFIN
jgi:hypothetical protein